ncbi:MAG TPA: oligosaccharide flippase family protein [Mesotoga infera]|nr:oligosaccharide flippase family protein [Mesotoga infera]HRV03118.1 oligosaccharide flippase family protein [Mesotoga sp.]
MSSSPYRSLGKNTVIFAIGTFGSKAISLFMLPIFTRVLTKADYGKIDIITTSISLLLPLLTLNIIEAVFRFTLDKGSLEEKQAIFTSALTVGATGFLCLLLFLPIFVHFGVSGQVLVVFLALFLVDVVSEISRVIIRAEQKLKLFAISDMIRTATFASFGIYFVAFLRMGVTGYFLAQIIAALASTIIVFMFGSLLRYIRVSSFNKAVLLRLARYSLPLVPNTLGWWIINASDRFVLTYFLGFEAAGLYAVAHKFPMLISVFSGIFGQAWQISSIEQYCEETTERDLFYSNVFRFFYSVMFLLLIVLAIFLRLLVNLLVGEAFSSSWRFVPFLLIGSVFAAFSSIYGVGYLASKKTKGALTTTLWASAINMALNVALISRIGIQAASISTATAFIVMWILRVVQTKKYFSIKVDWRNFCFVAGISIVAMLIPLLMEEPFVIQIGLLVSVCIIQREEITKLVNLIVAQFRKKMRR